MRITIQILFIPLIFAGAPAWSEHGSFSDAYLFDQLSGGGGGGGSGSGSDGGGGGGINPLLLNSLLSGGGGGNNGSSGGSKRGFAKELLDGNKAVVNGIRDSTEKFQEQVRDIERDNMKSLENPFLDGDTAANSLSKLVESSSSNKTDVGSLLEVANDSTAKLIKEIEKTGEISIAAANKKADNDLKEQLSNTIVQAAPAGLAHHIPTEASQTPIPQSLVALPLAPRVASLPEISSGSTPSSDSGGVDGRTHALTAVFQKDAYNPSPVR